MSINIIEKFKQFDAYAKTLEDFRVKTFTGAAVTILGGITMFLLFISEFNAYMSPDMSEQLFVDTSRSPKLKINLDIIVPKVSCSYLVLDAMDTSGEQHLQIDDNIFKRRLDLNGKPIDEGVRQKITTSTPMPKVEDENIDNNDTSVAVPAKCGSCYGAAFNESQCCNTCDEVKQAYRNRRWAIPDLSTIEQCKDMINDKSGDAFNEGCQIYGHMEVNRVGGSFHIAPGQSFSLNHIHVHDVQPYSSGSFNTTHTINHLTFGDDLTGAENPLKNAHSIATEGGTMFQYYIKIVPIMIAKLDGSVLYSNQYSVTRHQKTVTILSGESGMPGIFFQYELSPLMVKYTERSRSFGHFATSICAIVGGVFTVAGILDAVLYHSLNALQKKIELGKAS